MKFITRVLLALALSAAGGATFADGTGHQNGDPGDLAGQVFLVEVTILSSPFFPEYEGAVFPSCFTFEEDGTWIDLEWPGEGAEPIPGVWVQHTGFPHVTFTATSNDPSLGWTLIEYGVAGPSRGPGMMKMKNYAMVFTADNELVFYIKGTGHAVDACPL